MEILGFHVPFTKKINIIKGDKYVAHFGFGTAGEGIQTHGRGAFYDELKLKNIEVVPYGYYRFQTGSRRDDLPTWRRMLLMPSESLTIAKILLTMCSTAD